MSVANECLISMVSVFIHGQWLYYKKCSLYALKCGIVYTDTDIFLQATHFLPSPLLSLFFFPQNCIYLFAVFCASAGKGNTLIEWGWWECSKRNMIMALNSTRCFVYIICLIHNFEKLIRTTLFSNPFTRYYLVIRRSQICKRSPL